jgi:hypothetical protein
MKDFILKEIFWFIVFSIAGLFLSLLYLSFLKLTYAEPFMNDVEKVFTFQLYFIGWIISLISLYIVRITISVLKKMIG